MRMSCAFTPDSDEPSSYVIEYEISSSPGSFTMSETTPLYQHWSSEKWTWTRSPQTKGGGGIVSGSREARVTRCRKG